MQKHEPILLEVAAVPVRLVTTEDEFTLLQSAYGSNGCCTASNELYSNCDSTDSRSSITSSCCLTEQRSSDSSRVFPAPNCVCRNASAVLGNSLNRYVGVNGLVYIYNMFLPL